MSALMCMIIYWIKPIVNHDINYQAIMILKL